MRKNAKKKPMTTAELFEKLCGILKDKGKLPDILDYGLATHEPVKITNYEFGIKNKLNYGENEGIYLDLWLELYGDGEKQIQNLGTFKTLRTDDEAMHIMAALLADFIIEEYAYVNANLDDFTWQGVDVYPYREGGEREKWGYSCHDRKAALKRKDELLKKYPKVVVRDNETRQEKIYEQEKENGRKDT